MAVTAPLTTRHRPRADARALTWPAGVRSAGIACGIKGGGAPDLGVLVADSPVEWAGTFTKNAAAAAPVLWSRARLGGRVRAVVVNSGNANACTGPAGEEAVERVAIATAASLGCAASEVLVASTGPIGVALPVEMVLAALPRALRNPAEAPEGFATAILTTDTGTKISAANIGRARMVGVAKGAAMLAPNMATMLAFLVTDAIPDDGGLQDALTTAVGRTFDRICVDACESTNDSVFMLSTGRAAVDPTSFAEGLTSVCYDLAELMARDAEGGTKLVRVLVRGASSEDAAADLGRAVAASTLWRAAAHGGDPNWGRVLAALGARDRTLGPARVVLSIGGETVFRAGAPCGSIHAAAAAMAGDEITVTCTVGDGPGEAEVLSADMSPDYVTLNACGTT